MGNILDSFKGLISDEVLSGAAGALGENKDALSGAFEGAIPSILGGLLQTDPQKHDMLSGLFGKAAGNSNLVGDILGSLTGGGNSGGMMNSIVTGILGDKVGGIVNIITNLAGIKKGSSSSVMGIAGSLLASFLGKKMSSGNMNFGDMLGWLKGGQDDIVKAAPAGVADLLGIGKGPAASVTGPLEGAADKVKGAVGPAASVTGPLEGAAGKVTGAAGKVVGGVGSVAGGAADAAGGAVKAGGGLLKKILPIALLALLAILAWKFFGKGCNNEEGNANTDGIENVGAAAGGDIEGGVNDVDGGADAGTGASAAGAMVDGNWVADLGEAVEISLPDGTKLASYKGSVANKLYEFANDADAVANVDKGENWFNIENLFFDTGKTTIKEGGQEILKNVAAVLNAYPDMKVKVGGYTDNVGSAEGNLKLSDGRAKTVYNTLMNLGVAGSSFSAEKPFEGYGVEHPACPANDTPECKAQNRRTALVVTAK